MEEDPVKDEASDDVIAIKKRTKASSEVVAKRSKGIKKSRKKDVKTSDAKKQEKTQKVKKERRLRKKSVAEFLDD